MSLPLLTASAPGLLPSKLMVVAAGLVPLMVVLVARWRHGAVAEAPADARNSAWTPTADAEETATAAGDVAHHPAGDHHDAAAPTHPVATPALPLPAWARLALPAAGAAGLVIWLATTPRQPDEPPLSVQRAEAVAAAEDALRAERGFTAGDDWRVMPHVYAAGLQSTSFVWREGGRDEYLALRDPYALSPRWHVRVARFTGPVEERAEEYRVIVRHDGTVHRVEQQLPEGRAGAELAEEEARAMAHATLAQRFGRDAGALREVTANATSRPARRDWEFVFADDTNYPLEDGEARLAVLIAGDAVVDAYPYIHVPEEWSRAQRRRQLPSMVMGFMGGGFIFGLFAFAIVVGVIRWSRGRNWPTRFVLALFAGALLLLGISFWNGMPAVTADFMTAQPWQTQLFAIAGVFAVILLIGAAGVAIAAGLVQSWKPDGAAPMEPLLSGASLGLAVAGLSALLAWLTPARGPVGGSYDGADAIIPVLAAALGPIAGYVTVTLAVLILLVMAERFTEGWTRQRAVVGAALFVTGTILLAGRIPDLQWTGLLLAVPGGAALVLFYLATRRLHLSGSPRSHRGGRGTRAGAAGHLPAVPWRSGGRRAGAAAGAADGRSMVPAAAGAVRR
jgi:succinate dehydrogenase hydrophobic anchor subunit